MGENSPSCAGCEGTGWSATNPVGGTVCAVCGGDGCELLLSDCYVYLSSGKPVLIVKLGPSPEPLTVALEMMRVAVFSPHGIPVGYRFEGGRDEGVALAFAEYMTKHEVEIPELS